MLARLLIVGALVSTSQLVSPLLWADEPVEPAPVEPAPVERAPVEPAPVEPPPAAAAQPSAAQPSAAQPPLPQRAAPAPRYQRPPPQGYPPQPYPYPPQYYPRYPQRQPYRPLVARRPPVIPNWDPERPPPNGYELRTSPNGGLLGVGVGMLAIGWIGSAAAVPNLAGNEDEQGIDGDGVEGNDWLPLILPIGGPLWAIYTVNANPATTALLVIDSAVQFGGLVLIIAGALSKKHRAVLMDDDAQAWQLTPILSQDVQGLALKGTL